jgi:hypothetical protein
MRSPHNHLHVQPPLIVRNVECGEDYMQAFYRDWSEGFAGAVEAVAVIREHNWPHYLEIVAGLDDYNTEACETTSQGGDVP